MRVAIVSTDLYNSNWYIIGLFSIDNFIEVSGFTNVQDRDVILYYNSGDELGEGVFIYTHCPIWEKGSGIGKEYYVEEEDYLKLDKYMIERTNEEIKKYKERMKRNEREG